MIGLVGRILKLAEGYRKRIILAAVFSFLKAFISKAPIILAFYIIFAFIAGSMTGKSCVAAGAALAL